MGFFKQFIFPLLIILLCMVLLYSAYYDVKKETINQMRREQMTHSHQAETGIKLFFEDYKTLLDYMAEKSSIVDLDESGKELINHIRSGHTSEIKAITRIDENGKIIYTAPYDKKYIGRDLTHQEHIKKFLRTHKETLSDVFDAIQGYRSIAYYAPLFKNGVFKGGVAILIPFETISKNFLSNIKIRETGAAWTVSHNGIIIYSPISEYNNKNVFEIFRDSKPLQSLFRKATEGEVGFGLYNWNYRKNQDGSSHELLISYYPIKVADQNWTILVTVPESEALSTMKVFMGKWVIIVFLLIMGASIYLYYINKAHIVLKEETRRKKAEEAMRQSEQKFKTLFQTAGDAIFLLELDGKIIEVNNYAINKFEYSRDEFLQLTSLELNLGDNRESVISRMQLLIEKGELYFETVYRSKSGINIPVGVSIRLIEYEDRRVALSIARDISLKKREEEELIHAKEEAEKASNLKSEFLAQMSHEIRSPLNVVVGFTQLLREELKQHLTDEMITSFKGIDTAGKRIIRTVELILNMSELQTGMYEPSKTKFDLVADVINNVFKEFEIAARKKGLTISLSVDSNKTALCADYFSTCQIFVNLIDNAIKYTPSGRVDINVGEDKRGRLLVAVADTGIGISSEYLPKLFDPFTQEEQGYSRKYEGTGLGMALVKRYCELNNIEILVDTLKGAGTKYLLLFPEDAKIV